MAVDEELNDLSVEEIAEGELSMIRVESRVDVAELPESSPRYVVLSHELVGSLTVDTINSNTVILTDQKHPDGRISYPLILINWSVASYLTHLVLILRAPSSSPTDLMTLHASSLSYFQQVAEIAKVRLFR